jgi:hypothetical protein
MTQSQLSHQPSLSCLAIAGAAVATITASIATTAKTISKRLIRDNLLSLGDPRWPSHVVKDTKLRRSLCRILLKEDISRPKV